MEVVKLYYVDSKIIGKFDGLDNGVIPHIIDDQLNIKLSMPENSIDITRDCLEEIGNNNIMFNMKKFDGLEYLIAVKKEYEGKQIVVVDVPYELAVKHIHRVMDSGE